MKDTTATPRWRIARSGSTDLELALSGDWDADNAAQTDPKTVLAELGQPPGLRCVRLTAADLGRWDSVLMIFLLAVVDRCREEGIEVDGSRLPEGIRALLDLAYAVPERAGARRGTVRTAWLAELGNSALRIRDDAKAFTRFLGEAALSFAALAAGRARFRKVDLWLNIQECGPSAVPIVTLISLLVGLILAFVGAVQLALFGAQIYIADLVALGMLREMGALMTAIIMAGRTGAAFAAQLGTMNVNQEISALRVMGFAPLEFLVLPRMLALILVMPVLCLYANLLGVIGGGMITVGFFDVSLTQYLHRTQEAAHLTDLAVGLAKCTVFGILIALAGCMRGMQCGRSASAVGDAATSAVVTSIVLIVVSDSIITLICDRLGI
ncbi:ABC transporter permease [Methylotetracoccus oryzae]|uniref:ABC transporter permease n=1 Tax=Methylotetracoccus oryzae TaxID=1919059 RepID=UPI00111B361C|nr:MlaE family lipid ABC transporter permease subunit [Methylotetracoccus oryzae]